METTTKSKMSWLYDSQSKVKEWLVDNYNEYKSFDQIIDKKENIAVELFHGVPKEQPKQALERIIVIYNRWGWEIFVGANLAASGSNQK